MIAIRHSGTGEVQFVTSLAGHGAAWSQVGGALPAGVPVDLLTLSGGTWIEDSAKVRAQLLAAVKAEAEARKMAYLTPGGAKTTEYSDQAAEVRFFWSLGGSVQAIMGTVGLWSADRRAAVFPRAVANAGQFGDTIDKAIARFLAGMAASAPANAIGAVEAKACAAIKAATTVAAMRAVVTGITWPA